MFTYIALSMKFLLLRQIQNIERVESEDKYKFKKILLELVQNESHP